MPLGDDPTAGLTNFKSSTEQGAVYPWDARDNFWATAVYHFDESQDRAIQAQCIYPRGMDWPWGQALLDMDRTTVQLRNFPTATCNELCARDYKDEQAIKQCIYSKHGKTCVADPATISQIIPNYTTENAVTPY